MCGGGADGERKSNRVIGLEEAAYHWKRFYDIIIGVLDAAWLNAALLTMSMVVVPIRPLLPPKPGIL